MDWGVDLEVDLGGDFGRRAIEGGICSSMQAFINCKNISIHLYIQDIENENSVG